MNNDVKKLTLDELYISPFSRKRVYNEQGTMSYVPIERNLRPTGVEVIDSMLQSLASGMPYRQLGRQMGLSTADLTGLFRTLTGLSAPNFCLQYSLRLADDLLRYTDMELDEIARRSGFGTAVNLFYTFRREYDCAPGERRHALRRKGDVGRFGVDA